MECEYRKPADITRKRPIAATRGGGNSTGNALHLVRSSSLDRERLGDPEYVPRPAASASRLRLGVDPVQPDHPVVVAHQHLHPGGVVLGGEPLEAGHPAAVLDVVHQDAPVQVVDARLAVLAAAQQERARAVAGKGLMGKNSYFCRFFAQSKRFFLKRTVQ